MTVRKIIITIFFGVIVIMLSACMANEVTNNEQQKRMQRCEQYIDREREQCLQGDHVTIEDYKEDYRAYQKSKQQEADKARQTLILSPKAAVKPVVNLEEKLEDKPEDKY